MTLRPLVALCVLLVSLPLAAQWTNEAVTGPTPIRAVWHHPVERNDAEVDAVVARCKKGGINRIYLETIYEGRACYPSKWYEPHADFKNFDALRSYMVAGRKYGVTIDAWCHVFFVGFADSPFIRDRADWLARDDKGRISSEFEIFEGKKYHFLCPASVEARRHVLEGLKEAAAIADGLQVDYIRYPVSKEGQTYCHCARCAKDDDAAREARIVSFVSEVRAALPKTRLSASVFPNVADARQSKRQNWPLFDVDEMALMAYVASPEAVAQAARQAPWKKPLIMGLGPFMGLGDDVMVAQTRAAKEIGVAGIAYFALHSMPDSLVSRLRPVLMAETAPASRPTTPKPGPAPTTPTP